MNLHDKFFRRNMNNNPEKITDSNTESDDSILLTLMNDRITSNMLQDLLKNNGIPFLCRQYGACEYSRSVGGLGKSSFSPDYIYVNQSDEQKARGLLDAFINYDAIEDKKKQIYFENK